MLFIIRLIISISLALYIYTLTTTPRWLTQFSNRCENKVSFSNSTPISLRIIDNSRLPHDFKRKCIYKDIMNESTIIVNRKHESTILSELAHQSEIPTSIDQAIPIGELLTPSHILVLNQKGSVANISLTEIKTGKYLINNNIEYSHATQWIKRNSTSIFYVLIFLVSVVLAFSLLKTLMFPIDKYINLREKRRVLDEKLDDAKALLIQNKINSASKLLVECAQSSILSPSKQKAQDLLGNLKMK